MRLRADYIFFCYDQCSTTTWSSTKLRTLYFLRSTAISAELNLSGLKQNFMLDTIMWVWKLLVCHPRCVCVCVCENWKGYAVKHNYVNYDVLMTILDNYMFLPLLVIFRLSSRERKFLLYTMCAHVMERSLHPGFVA